MICNLGDPVSLRHPVLYLSLTLSAVDFASESLTLSTIDLAHNIASS